MIFEAETRTSRLFDLPLIAVILASVAVVVVADSVPAQASTHGSLFHVLAWTFTLFFTGAYLLRPYCVGRSLR
ncbi:MAG: hypothetical protein RBS40_07530 [Rhodocyclaceae bacterium]|nr:hypothetical protein [Rhodocyclaceae bacterium]